MSSITEDEWTHAVDSLLEDGEDPTEEQILERIEMFREQAADWHAEQAIGDQP